LKRKMRVLLISVFLFFVPLALTDFTFTSFNSSVSSSFVTIGGTTIQQPNLVLIPFQTNDAGAVWITEQLPVRGFKSVFTFTILSNGQSTGEDGFTFTIQTGDATASGPFGPGLGYGNFKDGDNSGIRNSVVIEFDTFMDSLQLDPNGNHLSVHARPNSAPNCANETYSLGSTTSIPPLRQNNTITTVAIEYLPIPHQPNGNLTITLNDFSGPSLTVPMNLESYVPLNNGNAWIGFTASTGSSSQSVQIHSWSYQFLGVTVANESYPYGDSISSAVAGQQGTFFIQGVDQFGNNMTSGGATFIVVLSSDPAASVQVIDHNTGLYTVTYTTTVATNAAQWSVTLGGQPLVNTPVATAVSPGPISPGSCFAEETGNEIGLHGGEAGAALQFTIVLKDQYGNQLSTTIDPSQVSVTLTNGQNVVSGTVDTSLAGYAVVSYTILTSGSYQLSIKINNQPIQDSTFTIQISPSSTIDPAGCVGFGSGLSGGTAGVESMFYVQLVDIYGNNITSGSATVAGTLIGTGANTGVQVNGQTKSIGSGVYSISYLPQTSGTYQLQVVVNGGNIAGSPFNANVYSANTVSPQNSVAFQLASEVVAGAINVFLVQPEDPFGNNITVATSINFLLEFENSDQQPISNFSYTYQPANNGLYQISYNITLSGPFKMFVAMNSSTSQIEGSPFQISTQPSSPCASTSVVYGDGLTDALTDQTETFTIESFDCFDNKIVVGGGNYTVSIEDHGKFVKHATVKDNHDGTYKCQYKLSDSGTYTVIVSLAGQTVYSGNLKVKWAGLSTGTILGICFGAIAVVVGVGVGVWFYRKKFAKRSIYQPLETTEQ